MKKLYRYKSLDDFLRTAQLHVDGCLDDGSGAQLSVKGRELDAAILFCDISAFSARTLEMTPTETLIFVDNFFAWITAEAMADGHGIVDKYIGDEVMIVFSEEFGSADPVKEALQAAHAMCDRDFLRFQPHIGIAAGRVTVGYVGTPFHYDCSVFGAPVALAARCAGFKPSLDNPYNYSTVIIFTSDLWEGRDVEEVFPPRRYDVGGGEVDESPQTWRILGPFDAELKNLPNTSLTIAANTLFHRPMMSAEQRTRENLKVLSDAGRYWPRWQPSNHEVEEDG